MVSMYSSTPIVLVLLLLLFFWDLVMFNAQCRLYIKSQYAALVVQPS